MSGRVMNRNDRRYDWIVSDGSLLNITEHKLLLESPPFGGESEEEWTMTLHLTLEKNRPNPTSNIFYYQNREIVELCVANKDCVGKSGYRVEAGFLDHDGKEVPLHGSERTNAVGMCLIETTFEVATICSLLYACKGRLVVYCKITDPE